MSPHPHGQITVLHEFQDSDGQTPYAGLVQGTDGNFYGTASAGGSLGYGTIYQITANGSFSVLYNFDSTTGADPQVTLLQHTNGILYGDTLQGGLDAFNCVASGCGVFYSLDAGLGPFVSFLPASGKAGKTIQFLGQAFTGTSAVSFNGTPAAFTVESDTYLTATVPAGATTGEVTVTTPGGPLISNKNFLVVP